MINPLLAALAVNDKKGFFVGETNNITYKTGFDTFDHRLGYILDVYNEDGTEIVDSYPVTGIEEGSITTMLGETQTGKTTIMTQMAYNIVKDFEAGFVMHVDLEKSISMARVVQICNDNPVKVRDKYKINATVTTFADVLELISTIADAKLDNKKQFQYDTGKVDMFGKKLIKLQPTVVLIDSLTQMQTSEDKAEEMEGLTLGGRKAALCSQFYNKLIPIAKKANILVFVINHVKDAVSMSMADKKKAVMYHQKHDKVVPGGKTALYLSHNICYLDTVSRKDIYSEELNGFAGMDIKCTFWKTRTNFAGSACPLVFNQARGYDNLMALLSIIKENGLIGGRNPGSYFKGAEELGKFDTRKMFEEMKRPEIQEALKLIAQPFLDAMLSTITDKALKEQDAQNEVTEESMSLSIRAAADEGDIAHLAREHFFKQLRHEI